VIRLFMFSFQVYPPLYPPLYKKWGVQKKFFCSLRSQIVPPTFKFVAPPLCACAIYGVLWVRFCNITCIANTYKTYEKKKLLHTMVCILCVRVSAPRIVSVAVGARRAVWVHNLSVYFLICASAVDFQLSTAGPPPPACPVA